MNEKLGNQKGLTLVEVLAVLVLTSLILGFIIYLLNYSNSSFKQVSEREAVLQQSRDILNNVTKTVRDGYIPSPLSSHSSHLLLISAENDQAIEYIYNADKTLTFDHKSIKNSGQISTTATTSFTFPKAVENIIFDVKDGRIEITLDMKLPNNKTHQTSTIVYPTQRRG